MKFSFAFLSFGDNFISTFHTDVGGKVEKFPKHMIRIYFTFEVI